MKTLFEESRIGSLYLKTRILRTACGDSHGVQGHITEGDIALYDTLAEGGIGAVITGYTYVSDYGMSENIGMFGIYDDSFISEYRALTDRVHYRGGKIIMQLVHLGSTTLMKNVRVIAPSAVESAMTKTLPEEMTIADIRHVQESFVRAAERAKAAGFDGIELHGAHGFLLNQFLSPHYNRRTDAYGGSEEKRNRFACELMQDLRDRLGADYPILVKTQSSESFDDGITPADFVASCKYLTEAGASALEISGPWMTYRQKEPYFLREAAGIAATVPIPVILTGGIRDVNTAKAVLRDTDISYLGMCRPFINDPRLLLKWRKGTESSSKCVSCGACSRTHTCILNTRK